jgi:hypothetical protein
VEQWIAKANIKNIRLEDVEGGTVGRVEFDDDGKRN